MTPALQLISSLQVAGYHYPSLAMGVKQFDELYTLLLTPEVTLTNSLLTLGLFPFGHGGKSIALFRLSWYLSFDLLMLRG
jgi:hypothetical protein